MRCRRSNHSLGRIARNGDCPSHAHVRRASHLGRTASSIRPDMIFGKDRSCQYMPTPSSTIPWCVVLRKSGYARAEKPLDIRVHNLRGHEVDIAEITDLGGVSPIGGTFQRGWARRYSSRLLPRIRAMYIPSRSL